MIALLFIFEAGFVVCVLLRPNPEPASRVAWIAVILTVPVVGIVAYLLLGETSIGRKRAARMERIIKALPDILDTPGYDDFVKASAIHERHSTLFAVGRSISGLDPVSGNHADLMADSNAAIDAMVADIDNASNHVHLIFYIWMPDINGRTWPMH